MAANVVEIIISAQDSATGVIAKIGTALAGTGEAARKAAIGVGDFGKNVLTASNDPTIFNFIVKIASKFGDLGLVNR